MNNKENLQETENSKNAEMAKNIPVMTPPTDIYEEKDSIVILCDMPGVSEKSVEVSYEDDVITLMGTQENMESVEGKQIVNRGFVTGMFKRSFTLLTDINVEGISAKIRDGVLRVVLPKSEKVKPKKINVEIG
ncbi:MAG: Hsp20/alpha crystallin family protein [Victivallales bacterium]|nr:Hsp20/alpha crystallin family protein [Victivallales bacterium]MCF7889317.1 Hsp20/alpha crystallin family protein [Victivallales bacterium]